MNALQTQALSSLSDDWQPLRDLPFDFNIYSECAELGLCEQQIETLLGGNNQPRGCCHYYRLSAG